MQEQLVEISDVAEPKETKTKSKVSHVDHVFQYDSWGFVHNKCFAPEPDDQSANLQDPVVYASLIVREGMSVMAGEIMTASSQQYTAHNALRVQRFLARRNIAVLE